MMSIRFPKYAFKELLNQLYYSDIKEITVTKEDNDLVIVIPDKQFSKRGVKCVTCESSD